MRSMVRWNMAGANWLRGGLGQAERDLAEVLAERRAASEGFLAMRVCYDLGQVQRAQRHLDAGLATYPGKRWRLPVRAAASSRIWAWRTWAWPSR